MKLFITSGGQRNIEDAIHHRVPVLGVSYSSSLEHYLRQVAKYEAGIISLIDFETQATFTDKLQDAFGLEMWVSIILPNFTEPKKNKLKLHATETTDHWKKYSTSTVHFSNISFKTLKFLSLKNGFQGRGEDKKRRKI